MKSSTYRPDIDGLRALAVVPVVIYHAMPGVLPGGYLGVDVFFVISGYLITLLMMRNVASGSFRFRDFYRRRIRRLAPALIVMVAAVLALGWVVYLPDEYARLGTTALSSLTALSNVYFALNSSYFDPDTDKNPLLHTWSLAVEEQFYLVFPLIAFACLRWAPRLVPIVLSGLLIGSLVTMFGLMARYPDSSYYLLHTRAWQLLAGSLLAYGHFSGIARRLSNFVGQAFVFTGLGLLALSYVVFSAEGGHPGAAILVPVLGTISIIAGGYRDTKGSFDFLTTRPLVLTGLASYSIYLWHQPIIVFYEEWTLSGIDYIDLVILVILSIATGFASWQWIEKPTRHGSASFSMVLLRFLAANAVLVVASFCIIGTEGMQGRVPRNVGDVSVYSHPLKDLTRECHVSQTETFSFSAESLCELPGDEAIRIAVWGSSHAASLTSGLAALENPPTLIQGSVSGCHPITGNTQDEREGVNCNRAHEIIGDNFARRQDVDLVIIHSRWGTFGDLADQSGRDLLYDSIRKILESGKRVVLVGSSPEQDFHVPQYMAKTLMRHGEDAVRQLGVSRRAFEARQAVARAAMESYPPHPNLLTVFLDDVFCTKGDDAYCPVARGLTPLYFDDDHLGVEGARLAAEYIREKAQEAGFW